MTMPYNESGKRLSQHLLGRGEDSITGGGGESTQGSLRHSQLANPSFWNVNTVFLRWWVRRPKGNGSIFLEGS